jgi:signal transduction histidine kinase/ligand-binding sensor domain-containing protein
MLKPGSFFCLWMLLALHTSLLAQEDYILFDRLEVEQGLLNNVVYDLAQDNRGYIWVATHSGLQKFDGNNFTTLAWPPGFQGVHIYRILPDSKDRIWAATSMGIFLLETDDLQWKKVSSLTDGTEVESFHEDETGVVWMSVKDGELMFYDPSQATFLSYRVKWPSCMYSLQSVLLPMNSFFHWFRSKEGIVQYHTRSHHFRLYEEASFSKDCRVGHFVRGNTSGKLWFTAETATGAGQLIEYDVTTSTQRAYAGVPSEELQYIHRTKKQDMLAFSGNALYVLCAATSDWINVTGAFSENTIQCFLEDRDGLIWVGTTRGIFVLKSNDQQLNYKKVSVSESMQLLDVSDSLVLTGSSEGAWKVMNQDAQVSAQQLILTGAGVDMSAIRAACGGASGLTTLVTERSEIIQADFSRRVVKKYSVSDLSTCPVLALTEASNGTIWMISEAGELCTWRPGEKNVTRKLKVDVVEGETVSQFYYDENFHCVWLMYPSRLIRIRLPDERVELFRSDMHLTALKEWEGDSMLLAADRGLFVFSKVNPRNKIPFRASVDFSGMHIAALEEDELGNLWLAVTGIGVLKVVYGSRFVFSYDRHDGVGDSFFLNGKSVRLKNDWIIFSCRSGWVSARPSDYAYFPNPRVFVTNFYAGGESVNMQAGVTDFQIPWMKRSVNFEFSSFTYLFRKNIYYSYMLEGFDTQWKLTQGETSVHYGNLTPGTYTFRVQAKTLFHNVLSDETGVTFTVETPLWQRWYFRLIIVLMIFGALFYVYWSRLRHYRVVAQVRESISRDLHDHIGSSLSSIGFMIQLARQQSDYERVKSIAEKISRTIQITQENLYDIIWHVSQREESFVEIIDRMREFMFNIFDAQSVTTAFITDETLDQVKMPLEKRYELYLVFKELINNAAKHANATLVRVEIEYRQELLSMKYVDDGVGFDMSGEHAGHGMKNLQERARRMNGKIAIWSERGKGTHVHLQFPVD